MPRTSRIRSALRTGASALILAALPLADGHSQPPSRPPEPPPQRTGPAAEKPPEHAPSSAPSPAPPAAVQPRAEPGAARRTRRFTPSEEVSPENDVPFPVDI
jgi:hypothetical protein